MDEELPPSVEVPYRDLDPDTLRQVIEAFILREGTDYGDREVSLGTRVEQIRRQLERREVRLVYDFATESCTLIPVRPSATPR